MSSSELHLSGHGQGPSAARKSSNSLVQAKNTYFPGKQGSFPTGDFQEAAPGSATTTEAE